MNYKVNLCGAWLNPGRQWHAESGFVGFATNGQLASQAESVIQLVGRNNQRALRRMAVCGAIRLAPIAPYAPASRINDIVLERRGITVDTAMPLVRYFGGDVQSWMNLQTAYEIKVAEQALAKKIKDEVQPLAA
jgi:hypothetical protein